MIGQHGNEQTKRTGDAGGTATAPTVCCALAVHRGRLEANHSVHLKPITELSLMQSNAGAEPREASASGNLLYDTRKNT